MSGRRVSLGSAMATGTPKPPPAAAPTRTASNEPVIHLESSPRRTRSGTYLDYEEKTARLTGEQLAELKVAARACEQDRKSRKESRRITDTTLIRVAVELLLDNPHIIRAATEDEILQNLRNSRTG